MITSGIMESMVLDFPEQPIALTLFRSTRSTIHTDGEPGGQIPGLLQFKYYLSPLVDSPDRARLSRLGQRLCAGLRNVQLTERDLDKYRGDRQLPVTMEFIKVEGEVVVTSVRQTKPGLEVRLFNPNMVTVPATIMLLEDNPEFPVGEYAEILNFEHQSTGVMLK